MVSEPEPAVIVVVPTPALAASPCIPELLLMIATVAELELQVTDEVMSWVLLSV